MGFLTVIDTYVFTWINVGCSNPVFDRLMPWITHLADSNIVWIWIFCIGLLVVWQMNICNKTGQGIGRYRGLIKAIGLAFLYIALLYGVTAGVYNGLKHVISRPRPFIQQTVVLRVSQADVSGLANSGSFPSGHACNAFMIAALLADRFRRKRSIFYGSAVVVALSRIYLGVHYPGDVLAGSFLGLAITWVMLFLCYSRNRAVQENTCYNGKDG